MQNQNKQTRTYIPGSLHILPAKI